MQAYPDSISLGFQRIVVATDFSDHADKALLRAVDLARRFDSQVVLTHIIDTLEYSRALNGAPFIPRRIASFVEDRLDCQAEVLRREQIAFKLVVRQGLVRDCLCDVVRDFRAGLLVVSTHGEQRFDRDVCGSIAEKILRVAPCPVFIMGPMTCPLGPRSSSPSRVLFATGFSDTSLRTLPFADALATNLGAELHLLHVASPATNNANNTQESLARLNDIATTRIQSTPVVHCIVQVGSLSETIASVARSIDAIATVLGVQPEHLEHKPLGGLRQGLIYTIASQACCPVITLHSGLSVSGSRAPAAEPVLQA